MKPFLLNRRRAVASGIALAAMSHALPARAANRRLDRTLRKLLPHRESAAAIGRAWLARAQDHEADRAFLVKALGPYSTSTSLRRQIREDFTAGRVVSLKGWILSLTETRGCALIALDMSPLRG